jgi:peptide chain release factor 2
VKPAKKRRVKLIPKPSTLIEEAEFKSTLNQPEDELPGVMQINSGAGGTESQDWAD